MNYLDKLSTSLITGMMITPIGMFSGNPYLTVLGFGLSIPSSCVLALDDVSEHDEFEEMRNELHKRDRLVERALEIHNMI